MRLNANERKVLTLLVDTYDGYVNSFLCLNFQEIMRAKRLDRKSVRRACRSLKRKGLAEFHIGLWGDDGPAGAGYAATDRGAVERRAW